MYSWFDNWDFVLSLEESKFCWRGWRRLVEGPDFAWRLLGKMGTWLLGGSIMGWQHFLVYFYLPSDQWAPLAAKHGWDTLAVVDVFLGFFEG